VTGDRTLSRGETRDSAPELPSARWTLAVLHTPSAANAGQKLAFPRQLRLGRVAGDVDLVLDDPRLSRVHARFARAGLVVEVQDLGSRNGTFVNGERVERRALGLGDVVRVGDTFLEVTVAGASPPAGEELVGRSPALLEAVALADRVAASDLPVLLLGETGTGKDVLARRLHARGGRAGALVAVNCAALPRELAESALFGHKKGAFTGATADAEGFFGQAEDGTLFLDEVGELPLEQQAKLLRVLESREYVPVGGARTLTSSARVIAATNVDLQAGGFRPDLYARLAGAVIRLPPLRARRGDVLPLAERFLSEASPGKRFLFSANAVEALLLHPWPRNVRELRMAMRRLALEHPDGGELTRQAVVAVLDPLPPSPSAARRARGGSAPSREELVERLTALRGNVNRVAEHYGKDPKQIYRWLKQHDLDPDRFRA
jgi:transcriptional regulator with GAF, ATPase, and Fis domain